MATVVIALAMVLGVRCAGEGEAGGASPTTTGARDTRAPATTTSTRQRRPRTTSSIAQPAAVVGRLPLGGRSGIGIPGGWAVAFGSAWVPQGHQGTVIRAAVSPRRKPVTITVDHSGQSLGPSPNAVAVSNNAVWVPAAGWLAVVAIDPATNRVQRTLAVGLEAYALAVTERSLWATDHESGRVVHVDLASGRVRKRVRVPGAQGVVATDSDAWVAGGDRVTRLADEGTRVVASIPVGAIPEQLVLGGGAVWVFNKGDLTVTKIDARTNKAVATIPVAVADPAAVTLAYGAGSLWVSDGAAGTLTRIPSQRGHAQAKTKIGARKGNAVYASGMLWLIGPAASGGGNEEVVEIDPKRLVR
jgi:YVTN family beta-propeller protein